MLNRKLFLIIGIFILFTSCTVKEKIEAHISIYDDTSKSIVKIEQQNGSIYRATANIATMYKFNINEYMKRELSKAILKEIATYCDENGQKFFLIISPKEVSNLDGRVINSVDEFIENFNGYSMKLDRRMESGWYIHTASMNVSFIMFKKRPYQFVVWDIRDIL